MSYDANDKFNVEHNAKPETEFETEPEIEFETEPEIEFETELLKLLELRASGMPLQYILGEWDFYGLTFRLGEGVLIPRPETEKLVDVVLEHIKENKSPMVLDLCAGTGCIGITIAKLLPFSKVFSIEKSTVAYEYIKHNIALHKVDNVSVFLGDVITGCNHFVENDRLKFDVIVSNPPYIPTFELDDLQVEVKFEPKMALDGGKDGLIFYRAIKDRWLSHLKEDGTLVMECGETQGDEIVSMFSEEGFIANCDFDFAGIKRVVRVIRQKGSNYSS